jgi:hypothetical protein
MLACVKVIGNDIAVGIFKETSSNDDVFTIYTISSIILYAIFC